MKKKIQKIIKHLNDEEKELQEILNSKDKKIDKSWFQGRKYTLSLVIPALERLL